jgi:hypothetical protein
MADKEIVAGEENGIGVRHRQEAIEVTRVWKCLLYLEIHRCSTKTRAWQVTRRQPISSGRKRDHG